MNYGNGGYKPIPGGYENIFSQGVPPGTYGVITPTFGSFGTSNTTPQISGYEIKKFNDNCVRITDTDTGSRTFINGLGQTVESGTLGMYC